MNNHKIIFRSILVSLTPIVGIILGIIVYNLLLQYTDVNSTLAGFLSIISGIFSSFGFAMSNASYFDGD